MVYVSFTQDEYSVNEDDGAVQVCLELSEAPEITQTPIWALIFGMKVIIRDHVAEEMLRI